MTSWLDMSATRTQPLRSADEYESAFNRLVKPRIGKLSVYEVRRSHVNKMLDEIEDANGPVMADRTLAYLRKAFNWYAARDDQFNVFADFLAAHPGDLIPPLRRKQERLDHISERVLGHVIAGVEGTYDRHSYADEKRDALERLAAMVDHILNPLPSKVATIAEHRARVQS